MFLPFPVRLWVLKIPRTPRRSTTPPFGSVGFPGWPTRQLFIFAHAHGPNLRRPDYSEIAEGQLGKRSLAVI